MGYQQSIAPRLGVFLWISWPNTCVEKALSRGEGQKEGEDTSWNPYWLKDVRHTRTKYGDDWPEKNPEKCPYVNNLSCPYCTQLTPHLPMCSSTHILFLATGTLLFLHILFFPHLFCFFHTYLLLINAFTFFTILVSLLNYFFKEDKNQDLSSSFTLLESIQQATQL